MSKRYPYRITPNAFELPPGEFDAYIFDCDGTLVDSMPMHLRAWRAALAVNGFPPELFTVDMHQGFAGMPGPAIVRTLNEQFGTTADPEKTERDKVAWYLQHHDEVLPVTVVADFARASYGKIPMGVASGSDSRLVHACLDALQLKSLFGSIITPDMVAQGKPAPDMFLLCAAQLGVRPERCLVFEDGHLGMDAAAAANMAAVFIDIPADYSQC
jgi:beta-phosphoglucomutase-like phosphatase (HAD superfamily)